MQKYILMTKPSKMLINIPETKQAARWTACQDTVCAEITQFQCLIADLQN